MKQGDDAVVAALLDTIENIVDRNNIVLNKCIL